MTSALARLRDGDREGFDILIEHHRREIQVHCYRMLGSLHDAEDATQDTLLRAWRARDGFDGRASLRTWLYRIATNTCLRAIERRALRGRLLPTAVHPRASFRPLGAADHETPWLEPYPDAALPEPPDDAPGPDARYEAHESIRLAFIAAIQELPPRQRAILLLRDVVGLTAEETAASIATSVAAANSALQRARATLHRRFPDGPPTGSGELDPAGRDLLERYVQTWEAGDVEGFVRLLAPDAVWSMPPRPEWFVGRADIGAFLGWVWVNRRGRAERLVVTAANGAPAFGYYRSSADGATWQPFAVQVVELGSGGIVSITNFVDETLFSSFELPPTPRGS
jgi:RNA polymerase sigma-70 factor (ECF subfamily)